MIIKATVTPLTFDEAHSFLYYIDPANFLSTALANNHPLNSFLSWLTTRLVVNEFSIRLPNIVAGVAYFYISARISSLKTKAPIVSFAILSSNPYLLEYFSLARGYGIAATLSFFAFGQYYFLKSRSSSFLEAVLFLVMSSFAVVTNVILTAAFVLGVWINRSEKSKYHLLCGTVVAGLGSIYPAWFAFQISQPGMALYGWNGSLLDLPSLVLTLFDPLRRTPLALLILTLLFLPFALVKHRTVRSNTLILSALGCYALQLAASLVSGRPYPIGRTLVPLLPILLLSSVSIWDEWAPPRWLQRVSVIAFLSLIPISTRLSDTFDWGNRIEPKAVHASFLADRKCAMSAGMHPSEVFYRRQVARSLLIPCSDDREFVVPTEPTSWTPMLAFGGASTGITYTTQSGTYVRAGRIVMATFHITLSSKGPSTGFATVSGWPYSTEPSILVSGFCSYYAGMDLGTAPLGGYLSGSTFNLQSGGTTQSGTLTGANFTNTSDIICSVTYPAS